MRKAGRTVVLKAGDDGEVVVLARHRRDMQRRWLARPHRRPLPHALLRREPFDLVAQLHPAQQQPERGFDVHLSWRFGEAFCGNATPVV